MQTMNEEKMLFVYLTLELLTHNCHNLRIVNMANPVKQYKDFYEMFNDIPNQMKIAVRKQKLMKIQSICKEED